PVPPALLHLPAGRAPVSAPVRLPLRQRAAQGAADRPHSGEGMSQAAFLQDMDAAIFGAFAGVGLADAALFKAGGAGAGTACTVIVDRNAQFFDDVQQVAGRRITIDLQKAEIAN